MGNDSSKNPKTPSARAVAKSMGFKPAPGTSSSSKSSVMSQRFQNAMKSGVLQFKDSGLKKVPDELEELEHMLRHLELGGNKLKSIPPYLGTFCSIKQIHLTENLLESLPDELGQLKTLEVLDVSSNRLTTLPATLSACFNLKTLKVSNNLLTSFPLCTCDLPNLDDLDVSKNKIESLPEEIEKCHANEINLNQNRLSSINSDALIKCPRLKILRVEENCLNKQVFTKELLESKVLSIIAYNGNLFQDKEFQDLPGYESYQERYTATKRKM